VLRTNMSRSRTQLLDAFGFIIVSVHIFYTKI